ncbi:MAG TPA: hypothetical protein PLC89_13800 [Haliscomenobacter sp.]|uniref:hypothetical protein n=1 Tax=Haliscomenobacter sp. TaxID=2717303 RepID=UPI002C62CDE9|nr:hypothetical protein [Haliscomenobacter sp.]HOY18374.1 hypothetical protein [Haliscomenobacter sp.]HPH20815.1 hypothetical protein [Haliscomenobacter sp.]
MKNFFFLLVALSISATAQAQNSNVAVFDEMLHWLNSEPSINGCNNEFTAILTNNTTRTNSTGKTYQYASFGQGIVVGRCACNTKTNITEMNLTLLQSFSDRNNFQGNKDKVGYRIFKQGSQINIEITSFSWGNGKSLVGAVELIKTALGYGIRWRSGDSYTTITFIKSGDSYSGACVG